ncbi:MAG: thiamine-phosphate synthase family protein [Candidatus Hermodarchaeia archaeon]|jgi:predicted fused transcriptional regulator/phosphomethylpyrimidine kinase
MSASVEGLKKQLASNLTSLLRTPGFSRLIPEVGSNFVACLPNASKLSQVAGLTGRIIIVRGKPHAAGEVDYGWSPFMGRVMLKAHSLDEDIRSAMSLRFSSIIIEAGRKAKLQVVGFRLPENASVPDCMTLAGLSRLKFVPEVLFDWGAHGIEPLVIVFGSDSKEVKERVQAIINELPVNE